MVASWGARLGVVAILAFPQLLCADPVIFNGQSVVAFGIVVFWALVVESGIATLTVVSSGVLVVPFFGSLFLANVGLFCFGFLPLAGRVSLWILEPGVVLVDAILIKLLFAAPLLQGCGFAGVGLPRVLLASILGNTASWFVRAIGNGGPWLLHDDASAFVDW